MSVFRRVGISVRIYEFPNGGWFYDLGFLIGLSGWASGTTVVVRR